MIIVLFAFIGQNIDVPDILLDIHSLSKVKNGYVAMGRYDPQIVLFDEKGTVLAQYHEKGNGPGEYTELLDFRAFDDLIYLIEPLTRKIITLDQDLQYIHEMRSNGYIRDLTPYGDHFLLVYWDQKTNTMLHLVDNEMKTTLASFVRGLEDKRTLGFQTGKVRVKDDKAYFIHNFIPQVTIIDLATQGVRSVPLPGYRLEEELVDFDRFIKGNPPFTQHVKDLFFANEKLYIRFEKIGNSNITLYGLSESLRRFDSHQSTSNEFLPDRSGSVFQKIYYEDKLVTLKPLLLKGDNDEKD